MEEDGGNEEDDNEEVALCAVLSDKDEIEGVDEGWSSRPNMPLVSLDIMVVIREG